MDQIVISDVDHVVARGVLLAAAVGQSQKTPGVIFGTVRLQGLQALALALSAYGRRWPGSNNWGAPAGPFLGICPPSHVHDKEDELCAAKFAQPQDGVATFVEAVASTPALMAAMELGDADAISEVLSTPPFPHAPSASDIATAARAIAAALRIPVLIQTRQQTKEAPPVPIPVPGATAATAAGHEGAPGWVPWAVVGAIAVVTVGAIVLSVYSEKEGRRPRTARPSLAR